MDGAAYQAAKPLADSSGEGSAAVALDWGVLNIDKPAGLTSHDVVARVRRITHRRRVGHAGTLDPLATGVLVVCVGRATRLVEYLMGLTKVYRAAVYFGVETNTFDAEGSVTAQEDVSGLTLERIEPLLERFRGAIEQVPPMYSALKREGRPLYELARQGLTVEREPRRVTIYRLQVVAWRPPVLELEVVCSKGTYIRSLAHDLGQAVGCGAHLSALRRTAVGHFRAEEALSLEALAEAGEGWRRLLVPAHRALAHLPALTVDATTVEDLCHGRAVALAQAPEEAPAAAYDADRRLVAILEPAAASPLWHPSKVMMPCD